MTDLTTSPFRPDPVSPRHVFDVDDLSAAEVLRILDLAANVGGTPVLDRRAVALIFEKPSTRTRASTEVAVTQLGGHPLVFSPNELGLDERETVEDVTRALASYVAAIGARVHDDSILERMASVATCPIFNLLSRDAHPCQTLADLKTIRDHFGTLDGVIVAWIGDPNNVLNSLLAAAPLVGLEVRVASPIGYEPPSRLARTARALLTTSPGEAARGADVVMTDTFTSMGWEDEASDRERVFSDYGVDETLMALASREAIFLHCLPAHRGHEVTAKVIDGPQSRVWAQARNRLGTIRALLGVLLETERGAC